ncbi:MAG: hypothetical protein ACXWLX_01665 [Rhizomicrobium sp.]
MAGSAAKILLMAAGLAALSAVGALAEPVQPVPSHTGPIPLDAPSVDIRNAVIAARIYLIDSEKGFYRGTRFDQSGVIGSLTLGGQNFYGPWFDRVSPEVMDYVFTPDGIVGGPDSAICGPVEEFAPVGFDQAAPGGTFLKIGVGMLRKPDSKPYDHYRLYDIMDAGKRDVRWTRSGISFTQDIAGAIRYVKTLRLMPGKPEMRIEHVLTNTGTAPISTTVYDHNFLTLSPGNQDIVVAFPFPITPDNVPDPNMVRIAGNRFAYVRPLKDKDTVSFHIAGFGTTSRDYDIQVGNAKTGAGMRVTADQPLSRLNLWSIRSVMAVEPYIDIVLPPGTTKRWVYTYRYTAPVR